MRRLSVNWGRLRLCRFRPSGGGFSRHAALPIRRGLAGAREDIRADAVIVSMSPDQAIPRHGCIPAEPAAVSPGKIIVPRIVIGEAILDQPAGGGFGAAKRGASSLRSRAARSGVVGQPASLAARRIRWRRAAGPCKESHTGPQAWSTDSRFLGPSTHRPGFDARSRAVHIPSAALLLRLWHSKR
jgi:hypothetical protein